MNKTQATSVLAAAIKSEAVLAAAIKSEAACLGDRLPMTFHQWIKELDRILYHNTGAEVFDLAPPNGRFWLRFDAGKTPRQVVAEIIKNPMEWI